jgi:nuclease-like protein
MFLSGPFSRGLIVGVVVTAVPCLVLFGFFIHTSGLDQVVGALGEYLTRDELAKAARHSHVWGSVHNVELHGMDIDHVVVAPGTILAIETKWHSRGAADWVLRGDVAQARQSASAAASVLRSTGVKYPFAVKPVVVVWGRGRLDIADGGSLVDGVRVIRGEELESRLAELDKEEIPKHEGLQLVSRLEAFAKEHRVVAGDGQRGLVTAQLTRLRGFGRLPWRRGLA